MTGTSWSIQEKSHEPRGHPSTVCNYSRGHELIPAIRRRGQNFQCRQEKERCRVGLHAISQPDRREPRTVRRGDETREDNIGTRRRRVNPTTPSTVWYSSAATCASLLRCLVKTLCPPPITTAGRAHLARGRIFSFRSSDVYVGASGSPKDFLVDGPSVGGTRVLRQTCTSRSSGDVELRNLRPRQITERTHGMLHSRADPRGAR